MVDAQGNLRQQYSAMNAPRGQFEQMLRQQALSKTPTQSTLRQADIATAGAQQGMNQAMANMAQTSGLSAGARERLQKQAQLAGMKGRQGALQEGEIQRMNLQRAIAGQEGKERLMDIGTQKQQYQSKLAEHAGSQLARQQMAMAAQQGKSQLLGSLGSMAGMGIGAAFGGPVGAGIGGSLGGMFGSSLA